MVAQFSFNVSPYEIDFEDFRLETDNYFDELESMIKYSDKSIEKLLEIATIFKKKIFDDCTNLLMEYDQDNKNEYTETVIQYQNQANGLVNYIINFLDEQMKKN